MSSGRSEISVVPVTVDLWDRLVELFAGSAGMSACFCMWPLRQPGTHSTDHGRNESELRALIAAGEIVGLLAQTEERAVGWCACGPRSRYPQYAKNEGIDSAWAIPCIYVDARVDRTVVSAALIEGAKALAIRSGAAVIDGPPPWWLPGDANAIATATHTFQDNGFVEVGAGARMPELRFVLQDGRQ